MCCADFWHHHALMMLSRFSRFCLYPISLFSRHSLVKHAAIVLALAALPIVKAQTGTDSSGRVDGAKAAVLNALNALGGEPLWSNVCLVQASGTMKAFRSSSVMIMATSSAQPFNTLPETSAFLDFSFSLAFVSVVTGATLFFCALMGRTDESRNRETIRVVTLRLIDAPQ